MKFSKMMKIINKLIRSGITEINKEDVVLLFGAADERLAEELRYLGCNVQRVADLFNVKFGEEFTKEEIKKQEEIERIYGNI